MGGKEDGASTTVAASAAAPAGAKIVAEKGEGAEEACSGSIEEEEPWAQLLTLIL